MELTDSLPSIPPDAFVADIDARKARTLRSFYPRIAKIFLFPDYFGKNLDALFDCLCSLEVVGNQHIILVIRHAELFLDKEKPEKRQAALSILREAEKQENRSDGAQFQVIALR